MSQNGNLHESSPNGGDLKKKTPRRPSCKDISTCINGFWLNGIRRSTFSFCMQRSVESNWNWREMLLNTTKSLNFKKMWFKHCEESPANISSATNSWGPLFLLPEFVAKDQCLNGGNAVYASGFEIFRSHMWIHTLMLCSPSFPNKDTAVKKGNGHPNRDAWHVRQLRKEKSNLFLARA